MNWNNWEMIWRRQEPPIGATADLAMLRETFETKRRKLARGLFARDLLEAAAGLLVAGVFSDMGWHMKSNGWPIAVAVVLVLGVTGFFVRERLRARRQRLGPDAPLLAKLEAEIAELRHQRRLLWNVWPWYLGPIVAAWTIVGVTAVAAAFAQTNVVGREMLKHPLVLGFLGGYVLLCLGLFWGVWKLNRRAVRTQIDPRLEELEKLQRDLLA